MLLPRLDRLVPDDRPFVIFTQQATAIATTATSPLQRDPASCRRRINDSEMSSKPFARGMPGLPVLSVRRHENQCAARAQTRLPVAQLLLSTHYRLM